MQVKITLDNDVTYDLYNDLGWLVDFEEMEAPAPKTNYVDIPARSGVLDLTEVDGTVYYEAVQFNLACKRICRKAVDILTYARQMMNLFNGQTARIYIGDNDYYYDGRISVGSYYRDGLVLGLDMSVTAYPYRLAEEISSVTHSISGATSITLVNNTMPVVPTISASAQMTITFNGASYTISSGDNIIIPNLVLQSGNNAMTIDGSGTITFTYQEGTF